MAYQRISDSTKTGSAGTDLDSFVTSMKSLLDNQIALRNAEEENNFYQMVTDNDMSIQDQLDYRKSQLKRVSDDPAEKKRLKEEIASLSTQAEQQKFAEEYYGKTADLASGVSSLDSIISWLNSELESTNDSTTRSTILKEISDKETEKFNLAKQLLENQTSYAISDKTDSVIDAQITRVLSAKNSAILAGNDVLASTYDLQYQSLNKAKNENSIQKDINNFAISTVTGYSSATSLLDEYNSKISSSSATGSVKIGDTTYQSAQEFWKFKRDSYLADTSSSGFFSRFSTEQTDALKVKSSQNNLSVSDLNSSVSSYNTLLTRPELVNYANQIATYKQDTLQSGANLLANTIVGNYSNTYDLNSAVANLNSIKSLGVNVDDSFNKILQTSATLKSNQVNSILQNAQTLMANDPTLSIDQAIGKATASGSAGVLSPTQLSTKSAEDIAKETTTAAQTGTFGTDTRTTLNTQNQTNTQAVQNTPSIVPSNQTSATPASTTPTAAIKLTKQLDFGVTDPEVLELQKFLNAQGFTVSTFGAGSAGNETSYFGSATQAALQKYQAAKGIVSSGDATTTGYGRLGPQTLASIKQTLGY